MNSSYKMIELKVIKDTPFEIGYKHGSNFKDQVHLSIETYEDMVLEYSNLSWDDACHHAESHIKSIEKYNIRYLKNRRYCTRGRCYI